MGIIGFRIFQMISPTREWMLRVCPSCNSVAMLCDTGISSALHAFSFFFFSYNKHGTNRLYGELIQ